MRFNHLTYLINHSIHTSINNHSSDPSSIINSVCYPDESPLNLKPTLSAFQASESMIMTRSLTLFAFQATQLMILIWSSILSIIQVNHPIACQSYLCLWISWFWPNHWHYLLSSEWTHDTNPIIDSICYPDESPRKHVAIPLSAGFMILTQSPALSIIRVSKPIILTRSSIMFII